MSDTWRENAIVQAIDIVTNKRIAQASFNTSIKAIVKQIKDKAIGEYILRYQDSDIIAYAASPNVNYIEGDQVIVQVPMNDLTQQKTILSTTVKHPSTFSDIPKDSDLYNRLGTNVVINQGTLQLSSYADTVSVIYDKQNDDNIIDIDINAINNYIKRGNGLAVGMFVQTLLDDSQVGGDYGLVITADFQDAKGAAATRSYVVSSKDVIGNPYSLKKPTFVERFFDDIDIDEFKGISSISIYCDGFPHNEDKDTILDIIFSNLQIYGAGSLTQKQLSGLALHIDYSQDGDTIGDEKNKIKVVAQLKVKGKVTTQNIRYYWFVQNGAIYKGGINTKGYSPLAGDGWECVNQFEDPTSKTKPVGLQTGQFTFCLPERDTTTQSGYKDPGSGAAALFQKQNRIKCVAEYSSIKQHISSQCIIYNSSMSAFDAKIVSSDILASGGNKTVYYVDNGSPSLTCKIYNEGQQIENLDNYSFYWTVVPMAGQVKEITDTVTEKEKNIRDLYTEYLKVYNSLSEGDRWTWGVLQISEEDRTSSQYGYGRLNNKEFLEWLQKKVKKYDQELKTQGNVLYHFPIASISGSSKINCAIFEKEQIDTVQKQVYLGSTSITLYNKPQLTGMYSLNLENGTQVFQYDKKGNSPASAIYEKPLVIQPLVFTLLDNTNKEIPFDQIIHEGQVKWKIPNKQTMLLYNGEEKGQVNQNFTVYTNLETFPYTIASNYDAKKSNNNIQLTVRYKDIILDTYTNFTFPKDGDPGTNGTDYVAKLIPEKEDADAVYISNFTRGINKDGVLPFDNQGRDIDRLKFLVYNNSKEHEIKVDTNYTTGLLKDGNNSLVLLSAEKNNKIYFNTANLLDTTDNFNFKTWVNDKKPVNIIRNSIKISNTTEKEGQTDQVRELTYYAQYPIIFNYIIKDNNHNFPLYRIKLKPKTGFKYVVYSEDGTLPDYDNTLPFELIVEKVVIVKNDNNEDITYYQPVDTNKIGYNWSVIGNLSPSTQNTLSTFIATPLPNYDGYDVSSAVLCEVSEDNNIIGYIHIPIYMSINRYGRSALNEWDGNSIDLGEGNGVILSPQVGAGKKQTEDNTFTGILIGNLKNESAKKEEDKDKTGLLGLYHGQQSIWLDSETGKAEFGIDTGGKIILDPTSRKAEIYSSNYSTEAGKKAGMKIDFTEPSINFGTGKFSVNSSGQITAQGGGTIANWKIGDNRLTSQDGNVYLQSKSDSSTFDTIYSKGSGNNDIFRVTNKGQVYAQRGGIAGWTIEPNRIVKDDVGLTVANATSSQDNSGGHGNIRIFAGSGTGSSRPFFVTEDGYLKSTSGRIAEWIIGDKTLTNGSVGLGNSEQAIPDTAFGSAIAKTNVRIWGKENNNYNFIVTNTGYLYSKAGKIGGWKITEDGLLYGNKIGSGAKTYTELSSDGTLINKVNGTTKWQIGNNGAAVFYNIDAKGGKIGSWSIDSGAITAGKNVSLNSDGSITAKNGTIAGFTIDGNQIKGTNLTLDGSDGSIIGKGTAQFTRLYGQIENGQSLTGNGVGIGGGGGAGSYVNPSSTYTDNTGNKTLEKRIKELAVGSLDVSDSLTFQKYSCKWQQVKIYTGATLTYITPSNIVTSVDFENQKAYGFSPSKIITNVKLTYRNLWLLTGDTVPGGEDSGSQESLVDGREIM